MFVLKNDHYIVQPKLKVMVKPCNNSWFSHEFASFEPLAIYVQ